jgi:uncharacterized protein YqgC (DUF456 family)
LNFQFDILCFHFHQALRNRQALSNFASRYGVLIGFFFFFPTFLIIVNSRIIAAVVGEAARAAGSDRCGD